MFDMDLFKDMLICDSIRGEDSTGAFAVKGNGNSNFLKLATHPFNLVKSKEWKDFAQDSYLSGRAVVGHNRKATEGLVSNKNTHPFTFGNIVLVHNGQINNYRSLLPQAQRDKLGVDVDSHAAAVLIARNEPERIISEMTGAFTFVWYDVLKKHLNFIRNEERPLAFANTDNRIFFASEIGMLSWLLPRRGEKIQLSNIKPGVLLTVDLSENESKTTTKHIMLYKDRPIVMGYNHTIKGSDLQRNRSRVPEIVPEEWRYNIFYGGPGNILEELKDDHYVQVVFSVDDFKPTQDSDGKIWILWGQALDSDCVQCIFHFEGTEAEVEKLAYTSHLIGYVRRIKSDKFRGNVCQEVILRDVRPVNMTTSVNAVPITEDHLKYLFENKKCQCDCVPGTDIPNAEIKDIHIERNGLENKMHCDWCVQAGEEALKTKDEAAASPST